jgi:hypothetical protein
MTIQTAIKLINKMIKISKVNIHVNLPNKEKQNFTIHINELKPSNE